MILERVNISLGPIRLSPSFSKLAYRSLSFNRFLSVFKLRKRVSCRLLTIFIKIG